MAGTREVLIEPTDPAMPRLPGDLAAPADARGAVLFAHGSGSSRKSPRNRQVAARPDLAGERRPRVEAATLLVVGGNDPEVLELNREARGRMRCPTELVVIPGAGHLFEEPGAMERVSGLAAEWFGTHL